MIRYEVTLPESGCKLMGVAESIDTLKASGWNVRITGKVPVVVLERVALEQATLERLEHHANQ